MQVLGYQPPFPGSPPDQMKMKMIIMIDDNGVRWTVPDDPANSDRQKIAAWEAEGNTIPAEAPPDA